MSSPKAVAAKTSKVSVRASDTGGVSGEDKARFVKAMWEGLKPGDAPPGRARPKAVKPAAKAKPAEPKLEILRKIPAPVTTPARRTAESDAAQALAARLETCFEAGDLSALTPEAFQALMVAMCKIYGASVEAGAKFPALGDRAAVTGTDVMIVCGALLKAVDLQVFELGMWQSWSGV